MIQDQKLIVFIEYEYFIDHLRDTFYNNPEPSSPISLQYVELNGFCPFVDTPDFPHESSTIRVAFVLSYVQREMHIWTIRYDKAKYFSRVIV